MEIPVSLKTMPKRKATTKRGRFESVRQRVESSPRLKALWACSNITAINRMHMNDHGPVHVKIVMRVALKLLELLHEAGVKLGAYDHGLDYEDAKVIVLLAAALHDIGHAVHRKEHEYHSLALAPLILEGILEGIYQEPQRTQVMAEVLHAIYAHRKEVEPLTVEAGIIKVADALDMEKGRARIPFQVGVPTIHTVSALAIEKVEILKGKEKPIHIRVRMSNSAGIFQLDSLFKEKLARSGLKDYIEVSAEIEGEEKKIIEHYAIE